MARLLDQIREAVAALKGDPTDPALIGGLALAAHQVVRATQDVDFLVDADDADRFHEVILGLGYTCIHRSGDVANYVRGDEGLDLLYAYRPVARKLLEQAEVRETTMGPLRVISVEGLTSLQKPAGADEGPGPVLVREGGEPYTPGPHEDPFVALFELMEVVEALCPEWPVRKPDTRPGNFLL